jgi:hypothetical protein
MGPMEEREPLIVAIFDKNFTDIDMKFARTSLMELGLKRVYFLTTEPATETSVFVTLDPDTDQERIDEVVTFLEGVEHVRAVTIGSPSWEEETQ